MSNGGVSNSFCQLVEYDSERLATITSLFKDKLSASTTRARDIFFHFDANPLAPKPSSLEDILKIDMPLTLTLWPYTGIGPKQSVTVQFAADQTCSYEGIGNDVDDSVVEEPDEGGSDGEETDAVETRPEQEVNGEHDNIGSVYVCRLTGTRIRRFSRLSTTVSAATTKCTARSKSEDKVSGEVRDMRSYAVRSTMNILEAADSSATIRDSRSNMAEYELAREFVVPSEKVPVRGWGRRPPHGRMYGANYLAKYRADVEAIFLEGVAEKTDKQHPSWVLQRLAEKYPHRFDRPSEDDIRRHFQTLYQRQKAGKPLNTSSTGRGPPGIALKYADKVEEILRKNFALKPAAIVAEVKSKFEVDDALPDDFPDDKQIKNKINAIKQRKRRHDEMQ